MVDKHGSVDVVERLGGQVLELFFGVGVGVVVAAEVAVIVGRGVAACGI